MTAEEYAEYLRRVTPPPAFNVGDIVKTIPGKVGDRVVKTELTLPVRSQMWHGERNAWVFFLARGGRQGRWYLAEELELVERKGDAG